MKGKILGILVCMTLLIATATSVAGFNDLNVVEISGGFGVTAVINNTGTTEAPNIPWSIYFCSGWMFIGGLKEGTINVPAGGETTIRSGLVFGFGPGSITVTAGDASKIVSCFVLGPFVLGIGPYPRPLSPSF